MTSCQSSPLSLLDDQQQQSVHQEEHRMRQGTDAGPVDKQITTLEDADENEDYHRFDYVDDFYALSDEEADESEIDDRRPAKHLLEKLLWRFPPEESHSDWTIEILVLDNDTDEGGRDLHTSEIDNDDDRKPAASKSAPAGLAPHRTKTSPAASDATAQADFSPVSSIQRYYVHKCMLAVGDRRCEYFTRLFHASSRDCHYSESLEQVSRIPLPRLAANAFPMFLDFIYQGSDNSNSINSTNNDVNSDSANNDETSDSNNRFRFTINTDNVTALTFLGNYFENVELLWEATQFWKKDLELRNCHVYYQHARTFGDRKILKQVAKCCVSNFAFLDSSSEIIRVADAALLKEILRQYPSRELSETTLPAISIDESRRMSRLVTEVFKNSANYMNNDISINNKSSEDDSNSAKMKTMARDARLFWELTDVKFLPQIDVAVAEDLLQLHDLFNPHTLQSKRSHSPRTIGSQTGTQAQGLGGTQSGNLQPSFYCSPNDQLAEPQTLSSLQLRCIDALAKNWRAIVAYVADPTATATVSSPKGRLLERQSPLIVNEVLRQALARAHHLVTRLEESCSCCLFRSYSPTPFETFSATQQAKSSNSMAIYDSILVSGAGISALNGHYRHSLHINSACCFQREGIWNGTRRIFSIVKWTDGRWYISVIRVFDFYSVAVESAAAAGATGGGGTNHPVMIPPRLGWNTSTHGMDPPPTLEFCSREYEGI